MSETGQYNLNFELIEPLFVKTKSNNFINNKNSDSILFNEFQISKNITLKNKLCYINLTDNSICDRDGKIGENYFKFYNKIAKSNVGLIVAGKAFVEPNKKYSSKQNFHIECSDEEKIKFENFTKNLHSFGTKVFLRIGSILGRADDENKLYKTFSRSVGFHRGICDAKLPSVRLSDRVLNNLVCETAKIAIFSDKVGFDGIVIDASLFAVFGEISSFEMNKRTFGYFNEKLDFSKKLISKIIDNFHDKNIIFQISFRSFIEDVYGGEVKKIKTLKSFLTNVNQEKYFTFLTSLVELGVSGFLFTFGTYETEFLSTFNEFESENFLYAFYDKINKFFEAKKIFNRFGNKVIFIYHDNINSISSINKIVEENFIIDVSKQLLANENYLHESGQKVLNKTCIKCSLCNLLCLKENRLSCAINPEIIDFKSNFNQINKRIAIIGSGYSGINAAVFLAERGAIIDLFEMNEKLNPHGRCREIFGFNEPLKKYNEFLIEKVNFFVASKKINLILNHRFCIETDNIFKYTDIIVATGFHEKYLKVPGAVLENVKSIYDALSNQNSIENKKNIVIFAKSELSLSLALFLLQINKNVSLIFESLEFLFEMPNDKLTYFLFELKRHNCRVFVQAKLKRIESDFIELIINNKLAKEKFGTIIMNMKSKIKYKYEAKAKSIDCDLLIYEPEIKPNNRLFYELVLKKFSGGLYMIGNALQKSNIEGDIKTAFFVSKNI